MLNFFQNISDDLFFLIVLNLPLNDIISLYSTILTAKKIRTSFRLQFNNVLLRFRTLKIEGPSRMNLEFISEKMSYINSLSLINCGGLFGEVFLSLKKLFLVEKLEIIGSVNIMVIDIANIISGFKNLRYLKINDCPKVSLNILKSEFLGNLIELDLSRIGKKNEILSPFFKKKIDHEKLFIFFQNCKKLKVFKMENNKYVDNNWLIFIKNRTNIDFEFHALGTKINNRIISCSSFRKEIKISDQENTSGIIFVTSAV